MVLLMVVDRSSTTYDTRGGHRADDVTFTKKYLMPEVDYFLARGRLYLSVRPSVRQTLANDHL